MNQINTAYYNKRPVNSEKAPKNVPLTEPEFYDQHPEEITGIKSIFSSDDFTSSSDNDNQDIFTGYCKEKNHLEILKFFCKTHNILCCASCLCKIKNNKYGQHSNCDVCILNDIKEEKKIN